MSGLGSINLTNQFLIAMPGMADDHFAGSVVYLCEHTERGALGLVINKPIDITIANLFERVEMALDREDLAAVPVHFGGPVQTERGFVLHDRPADDAAAYASSLLVPGGLAMTTSRDVLEALSGGNGPRRVLITLGYAGWGAGQLEAEIQSNGWLHCEADFDLLFDDGLDTKYERALHKLGIDPAFLSNQAGHA